MSDFIIKNNNKTNNNIFELSARKRLRTNTNQEEFDENEFNNKLLNFIIENNLSFNMLNSESTQDLFKYLNPLVLYLSSLVLFIY